MPNARKATLYRIALPDPICPFGVRAKQMLDAAGFKVRDCILKSRDKVDAFKQKYAVNTKRQVFVGGQRIGGSDELGRYLRS